MLLQVGVCPSKSLASSVSICGYFTPNKYVTDCTHASTLVGSTMAPAVTVTVPKHGTFNSCYRTVIPNAMDTLPIAPVPATPVTLTLASATTAVLPIEPVASTPVTETTALAATVTVPIAPVPATVTERFASPGADSAY